MSQTVLVTGASGNVRREVVAALQSFHPKQQIQIASRNAEEKSPEAVINRVNLPPLVLRLVFR